MVRCRRVVEHRSGSVLCLVAAHFQDWKGIHKICITVLVLFACASYRTRPLLHLITSAEYQEKSPSCRRQRLTNASGLNRFGDYVWMRWAIYMDLVPFYTFACGPRTNNTSASWQYASFIYETFPDTAGVHGACRSNT